MAAGSAKVYDFSKPGERTLLMVPGQPARPWPAQHYPPAHPLLAAGRQPEGEVPSATRPAHHPRVAGKRR
ncbi:MAG: hypothetical protein L0332_15510 [Chloroflexi bacterium]|nr:hypothetical protein [Chloroflexota bacterium]MCI0648936.1 hypothetical protein [Chloroflexota bacterium]MCI0728110.1 hypothetical protein [Chloroflexota bacterium]